MALNTFKCSCLTPLHFKGLRQLSNKPVGLQGWCRYTAYADVGDIFTTGEGL